MKRIFSLILALCLMLVFCTGIVSAESIVVDLFKGELLQHTNGGGAFVSTDISIDGSNIGIADTALISEYHIQNGKHVVITLEAVIKDGEAMGIILGDGMNTDVFTNAWICLNADVSRKSSRLFAYGNSDASKDIGDKGENEFFTTVNTGEKITLALEITADGLFIPYYNYQKLHDGVYYKNWSTLYPGLMTYKSDTTFLSLEITEYEDDFEPDYPENEPIDHADLIQYSTIKNIVGGGRFDYTGSTIEAPNLELKVTAAMTPYVFHKGDDVLVDITGIITEGARFGIVLSEQTPKYLKQGYLSFYIDLSNKRAGIYCHGDSLAAKNIGDKSYKLPNSLKLKVDEEINMKVKMYPDSTFAFSINDHEFVSDLPFPNMPDELYLGLFTRKAHVSFVDGIIVLYEQGKTKSLPK